MSGKYKEDEAIDFVYKTTDYSKFKILHGNRVINVSHLENLKSSFDEKQLKAIIYVNEDFEIIDGAHRFHVLMQMKKPIHYIICEGYGLKEVQIYNQNSKNWGTEDFLDSYIKLGHPEYLKFKQFQDTHKFPHSVLFILFWADSGTKINEKFKAGTIKITNYEEANKVAYRLSQVRKIIGIISCKRDFVRVFYRICHVPGYDHTQMLRKLEMFKQNISLMPNAYGYAEMLDSFYNYKQPSSKKLDILGYLKKKNWVQKPVKDFTK